MFPLPRLRFLEAVGVLLEKHNTPSQEFHEGKRGSWEGHIWGSACCVSTCCSAVPRARQGCSRAAAAPLGPEVLRGPRQASSVGTHTQTWPPSSRMRDRELTRLSPRTLQHEMHQVPCPTPPINIGQPLATTQAFVLAPILNNMGCNSLLCSVGLWGKLKYYMPVTSFKLMAPLHRWEN